MIKEITQVATSKIEERKRKSSNEHHEFEEQAAFYDFVEPNNA
jgi:hypothetical protein